MKLDLSIQIKSAKNKLGTIQADRLHIRHNGQKYILIESEKGLQLKKEK